MTGGPDYRATNIPKTKSPCEYSYVERRAEILQRIEDAGHPRAISQTRLADRYEVSQGQISQDITRLKTYINETVDTDTVDAITETVYQKSIKELIEKDEHYKAIKAVESWNNWLMDRGKVDKEADEHEVNYDGPIFGTKLD